MSDPKGKGISAGGRGGGGGHGVQSIFLYTLILVSVRGTEEKGWPL